jgi:hypothetical protein
MRRKIMGDMADYARESDEEAEHQMDRYVNGCMDNEEAYDRGILDERGIEQEGVQEAWDRSLIGTLEELNSAIEFQVMNMQISSHPSEGFTEGTLTQHLNKKAIDNLTKERPTCNICEEMMSEQTGKYGKFYYCNNYCDGQKTVSDKYWQSVKTNGESKK